MTDQEYKPTWKNRRRVIFATLLFCAFTILYILFKDLDSRVAESVVFYTYSLAGFIIAIYVFGATLDDFNFLSFVNKAKGITNDDSKNNSK